MILAAAFGLGDVVPNWSAPASWRPPKVGGRTTMLDLSNPLPFIPITPCRIADTRGNGFTGAYGPPALAGSAARTFTLTGQCGISTAAKAASLNITVVNAAGPGFILIYPDGGAQPLVSTLNYVAGQTVANAAVVPLGATGGVTVVAGVSGTDLIIDTNGYYYDSATGSLSLAAGEYFGIVGDRPGGCCGAAVIFGRNTDPTSANSWGGLFQADSSNAGSAGVFGEATSTTGVTFGLWGRGHSTTNGAAAIRGEQQGSSGANRGVDGTTVSAGNDAAGVRGADGSIAPINSIFPSAGVRGESATHTGVLGISRFQGVKGVLLDSGGIDIAEGYLGSSGGIAADAAMGPWGVFASGNLGASGAKHFVEPHPTDATKVIVYSSLEGREVGTYFRGSARTLRGQAVIAVPEDFAIVTDEEGLTVQVTPIGDVAAMGVMSKDLRHIAVRASKDVAFDYLVHGVRRAFKTFEPVGTGSEFMPRSATDRMPAYLTEEAKARLISNGTYNADGTVNMATAEKSGWTEIWAERDAARSKENGPQ
jgi:hypothetical protein